MIIRKQNGFTLVELLVVIGILAILLAITLIAINPTRHFQDSRNTQRRANVNALVNSIYEYETSNAGAMPPSVSNVGATATAIGRSTPQTATGTSFAAPNLTYSGLSGNAVTSGVITVTGCTQAADNGTFPVTIGTVTTIVVTDAGASAVSATGCTIRSGANLCTDLAPSYIADLPTDPTTGSSVGGATPCNASTTSFATGYTVAMTAGRFTIAAPGAEAGATISVTR